MYASTHFDVDPPAQPTPGYRRPESRVFTRTCGTRCRDTVLANYGEIFKTLSREVTDTRVP